MKVIISEQQYIRLITEKENDFEHILEVVDWIEGNLEEFLDELKSKQKSKIHPDFPLEHIVKFVISTIKGNAQLTEILYDLFERMFYNAIIGVPNNAIFYWGSLYCLMNQEMGNKMEICKDPKDINWEIVRQQSGIEKSNENKINNKLTEPRVIDNRFYETFEDAYKFMEELHKLLNQLAPSNKVCSKTYIEMLHRIYNTAGKMVQDLRDKYKSTIDQPAEKKFQPGSNDEKINNFILKYDNLPDNKFYEFAELFSKEIGVTVEEIRKKRLEFIKKKYSKLLTPTKWDDKAVRKDPLHTKAQQMFGMAGGWLDCCKKGYYDCDDDDPPFKFNTGPIKYTEPNVKYEPTIQGGGNIPSEFDTGGKKGGELGVPMNEQIKKLIRKHL